MSHAFTAGALFCLYAIRSEPSALVEQTVQRSASALAGIGPFALLRVVVLADRAPARDASLSRTAMAMAA
ncbi:hypothetical protein [Streptomyces sp. NPDC001292]|uniref:hypothetical protein n=1 Tax=Streptomyces sp. NPDC001292 TaxID=3364558 RepID=UPI0036840E51